MSYDVTAVGESELPVEPAEARARRGAEGNRGQEPAGVLAWRRLRRDRAAMISLGVIVLIVPVRDRRAALRARSPGTATCSSSPRIGLTPDGLPVGPNGTFWLGTDDLGRDLLVRIAYGARISLFVGVVATAVTVVGGTVIGLAAGYFGGIVDSVLARFMDLLLSVPFLLFAIALFSVAVQKPIFGSSAPACRS